MDMEKERIKKWVGEVYLQLYSFLSLAEETNFFEEVPEGEADASPEKFVKRKRREIKSVINNFSPYAQEQELPEAEGENADREALEQVIYRLKMKLRIILGQSGWLTGAYELHGVVIRRRVMSVWSMVNPRLDYFNPVYEIIENQPEYYQSQKEAHEWSMQYKDDPKMYVVEYSPFSLYPDAEMIAERNAYFAKIKERNERENLNWSEDRIFQEEILNTIKLLFEKDCEGYF